MDAAPRVRGGSPPLSDVVDAGPPEHVGTAPLTTSTAKLPVAVRVQAPLWQVGVAGALWQSASLEHATRTCGAAKTVAVMEVVPAAAPACTVTGTWSSCSETVTVGGAGAMLGSALVKTT